ncbi:hypothetical protein [Streptomyces sp. H27-H5]|uniref:hypothetical protein n=1 Tax=Streptomyces sp. H27-H5 TaxID=2996460 RepID=UPI00226E7E1C|nr:hypothetical protein [Streptomyces sp. H27-H5]MCY0957669.1 hypothetical protein [Streptomyces sp. H27-H5]
MTNFRPHPKDAEIRQLLGQGLTNAEIHRRLNVGASSVARIRAAAGIPPVPRANWAYPAHPKAHTIRVLLHEGYGNAEIARRTGADVATVARVREERGIGPSTIPATTTRWKGGHPKDAAIRALLADHSSEEIARLLHADPAAVRRIRAEAGITYVAPVFATALDKWKSLVREVDGGHLEWLGERGGPSRTPVMRFRERSVTPAGIAFTQRTGRAPVGAVRAECDYPGCMAPAHVDDAPGRMLIRSQIRALRGLPAPPAHCQQGHDQAVHGRYETAGAPYCLACKRDQKRAARATG